MAKYIDLHTHSLASDGTFSASDVVKKAAEIGLAAMALTDHDTTSAIEQAKAAGAQYGVEIIQGIEISARFDAAGTLHVLGYFIQPSDAGLQKGLEQYRAARDTRNPKIVEKLRSCGIDITYEEVVAEAKGVVGRPHIASVLFKKGYVSSMDDAFVKYLKRGGRAYVEKDSVPPEYAIKLIREAGGVAVLAHPTFLYLKGATEEKFFERLVQAGLGGVETYYSSHSQDDTRHYEDMAKRYDLVATGGSDFHGQNKPDIQLGFGFGKLRVPYEVLDRLREKIPAKAKEAS